MIYIFKISYFDQEPEREEFSSREEAMEAFSDAMEAFSDAMISHAQSGQAFGDVARMAVISHRGETYKTLASRDYE